MGQDALRQGYLRVAVVRSARPRLSPKRLSDRITENLEGLADMGGGDQGLMEGANEVLYDRDPDQRR